MNGFMIFLIFVVVFIAWMFPTLLAMHRHCKATGGIFVVNFFLGWTFIGWVVALAWAASGESK
jgi:hypothetical protein